MNSHDVSGHDCDYKSVLRSILHPMLIVGIDSDVLYPLEQRELANLIPNSILKWINSPHGHDAFLINMDVLNDFIIQFRHDLSNLISPSLGEALL